MNAKEITKGIFWAVLQLLGLCVLVWLLYQLKTLLIYMLIAGVVSLIGRPINHFLMKRLKMRAVLATSISIVLLLGILISLFSLFVPLLVQQGENLSLLDVDLLKANIQTLVEEISAYFQLDNSFWQQQFSVDNLFQNVNFGLLPQLLNETLELLGGFTIGLFSVVFILFFFLKDSHLQERIILALVNDNVNDRVEKSIDKTKGLLSRYFLGLLLQISILLVINSVVLSVFAVENAFIIAFLCALLNLIPYLGPIIGAVLMLLLTMSSFIGADFSTVILPKTIYVMIGFFVGQLVDNFISQPFIFSNSVKSHPLEIFIVILASGTLLGPVGMIIAIPLYTTLKVIAQEFLAENKIVKSLNIEKLDWILSYQSRVGPLKWIGPSTEDIIVENSKLGKHIVLVPIAFVSEHSETLVELDIEYKELADKNGCKNYTRVPALGTNENYIKAMSNLIINKQDYNFNGELFPPKIQCPNQFIKCPCLNYE